MEFGFSHCTLTNEVRVIENYKGNDPKGIGIATITEGPEGGFQIPFPSPNFAQIPVPSPIFTTNPIPSATNPTAS